jgi:hypothetical protein
MKNRRFLWIVMLGWATFFLACVTFLWAQAPAEPSQKPTTPPTEPEKPSVKPESSTPAQIPELDPDVKQWFLENHPPQKPFDPQDVDVLTGKTRPTENQWPLWNGVPMGPAWGTGYRSGFSNRWNSSFPMFFASPRFSLFGDSFGFGAGRFNNRSLFFGPPLFRPFGAGGFSGHRFGGHH